MERPHPYLSEYQHWVSSSNRSASEADKTHAAMMTELKELRAKNEGKYNPVTYKIIIWNMYHSKVHKNRRLE